MRKKKEHGRMMCLGSDNRLIYRTNHYKCALYHAITKKSTTHIHARVLDVLFLVYLYSNLSYEHSSIIGSL